uniref:DDE_Tnp_1_7 domain-containing protein n=1 Tax=Steinernema glaseri TaxID=37863 RepID=A0A1I7ZUR4_9BILA
MTEESQGAHKDGTVKAWSSFGTFKGKFVLKTTFDTNLVQFWDGNTGWKHMETRSFNDLADQRCAQKYLRHQ